MEKEQIISILDKAIEYRKKDLEIDEVAEKYYWLVAPSSHVPYFEDRILTGFLEWIRLCNSSLSDDLSRFLYEIDLDKCTDRTIEELEKKYIITDRDSFLGYLFDIYITE